MPACSASLRAIGVPRIENVSAVAKISRICVMWLGSRVLACRLQLRNGSTANRGRQYAVRSLHSLPLSYCGCAVTAQGLFFVPFGQKSPITLYFLFAGRAKTKYSSKEGIL